MKKIALWAGLLVLIAIAVVLWPRASGEGGGSAGSDGEASASTKVTNMPESGGKGGSTRSNGDVEELATLVPSESLGRPLTPWNAGTSTPIDALLTEGWGARQRNYKLVATAITFSEAARPIADTLYERLPEYEKEECKNAEEFWAALMMANPRRSPIDSIKIGGVEATSGSDVTIAVTSMMSNGAEGTASVRLIKGEDGQWRRVIIDRNLEPWYNQPNLTATTLAKALNLPAPPAPEISDREFQVQQAEKNSALTQ